MKLQKNQSHTLLNLDRDQDADDVLSFAVLQLVLDFNIHLRVNLQNGERSVIDVGGVFLQRALNVGVDACVWVRQSERDVEAFIK